MGRGRVVRQVPGGDPVAVAAQAAAWLRRGGLLVYPTDTFYAVGADPTSAEAVSSLFAWKGRPEASALPLVAADREQVETWFGPLGAPGARLAARWWPGPLSLIVPAGDRLTARVHADLGTVAVRVPDQPVARAIARAFGGPVPSTSANRSGQPPVTAVDALGDLLDDDRLFVVDGGRLPGGAPSTIVDARRAPITLVRAGVVPWNRVLESEDA